MKRFLSILAILSFSAYAEDAVNTFTLTTTAFLDQMTFPVLYTCQGKDISPQLDWVNPPPKTESFALIMADADAPAGIFYHWVLYNLPKSTTTLPEDLKNAPAGASLGKNSFNNVQYNGPCPPKGKAHTYVITLYALDKKINLPAGAEAMTVLNAIQKHIIAKATLSGVYTPWPPA